MIAWFANAIECSTDIRAEKLKEQSFVHIAAWNAFKAMINEAKELADD